MSVRILCVDDDPNILAGYQRNLRKHFHLDTARGGEQALVQMELHGPYAVVVADMRMPSMDGIQFLIRAREKSPETVRMMLTGNADQKTAMDAVNEGHVFRFLTKPCPPEVLSVALQAGLHQYRLITAERELLEKTLGAAIKVLTEVLSVMDPKSFGVGQMLRDYMHLYAQSLRLSNAWELELAAMLSQIGFVTIPVLVTQKVRAGLVLSGEEKDMVTRVPEIGANLLGSIPRLEGVAKIVLYQAKHYDGSGFPFDAVAGQDIPVGARILKVLTDLVQFESKGAPKFKALARMQERTGWYDPRVLDATFASFDIYLPKATDTDTTGAALSLKDLQVGHVLLSEIRTSEGLLIVTAGTRISQMLLEKLANFAKVSGIKEPIHVRRLLEGNESHRKTAP